MKTLGSSMFVILVVLAAVILIAAACSTSFTPLVDGWNGIIDGANRFTNNMLFK